MYVCRTCSNWAAAWGGNSGRGSFYIIKTIPVPQYGTAKRRPGRRRPGLPRGGLRNFICVPSRGPACGRKDKPRPLRRPLGPLRSTSAARPGNRVCITILAFPAPGPLLDLGTTGDPRSRSFQGARGKGCQPVNIRPSFFSRISKSIFGNPYSINFFLICERI